MQSDQSFDRQKNEICINVPFMHFIENYERIVIEKLSAVN